MTLLKLGEPEIDLDDPWARDDLNRRREGEVLTRLIATLSGAYTLAVKGRWGTGKSVFLRRLAAELESKGIPVVAVDAWRSDYLDDPIIALVAATKQRLERDASKSARLGKAAGRLISELAQNGAKLIVPVTSIVATVLAPGSAAAVGLAAKATEKIGGHLLEWDKNHSEAADQFRVALEKTRDHLAAPLGDSHQLVMMVDELDRCRPDFAIKMLERIKHYFNVPGVTFVIATDGKNLPSAVASLYGPAVNGEEYLRKFFDFEYELEDPKPEAFIKVLSEQFQVEDIISTSRCRAAELRAAFLSPDNYHTIIGARDRGMDAVEVIDAFPGVATQLDLSLRDQAQAFTVLNAYLRSLPAGAVIFPAAITFAVCVRFASPEAYRRLRNGAGLLNFLEGDLANRLVKEEWLNKTAAGWDLRLFANAIKQQDVVAYIHTFRENVFNEQSNFDQVRFAAATRLRDRLAAVNQVSLKDYLPRALKLVDAFS